MPPFTTGAEPRLCSTCATARQRGRSSSDARKLDDWMRFCICRERNQTLAAAGLHNRHRPPHLCGPEVLAGLGEAMDVWLAINMHTSPWFLLTIQLLRGNEENSSVEHAAHWHQYVGRMCQSVHRKTGSLSEVENESIKVSGTYVTERIGCKRDWTKMNGSMAITSVSNTCTFSIQSYCKSKCQQVSQVQGHFLEY